MSKVVREQLQNKIVLLKKATEMLERIIVKKQDTLALITNCQELALALKCRIEVLRGMNTLIVPELVKYCELLHMIELDLENKEERFSKCQVVNNQIKEIENAFYKDFPDKKEVVFLPYKASMWDSLESVWMAARDDENCEVYVVPIPYYEKTPDGALGKMFYEGEDFPDYVPIMSYQEYDLKLHHPDVVFVHNPYDEYNTITTIEPKFYCSKIKDFTQKLVYIPYFVLGEMIYEHFCVLPGCIYADYVIVQSDMVKDVYYKTLKEFGIKNSSMEQYVGETRLEKKLLVLGSPKIDKVINGRKENYPLPDQWKRIVSGKKVILYNTGVSGLLTGNEQELIKIKDTLEFFRHREDAVLWWRPHPLSGSTFQAMRPLLYKQYMNLIKEYKEEGFGIFDDTPDLHRALVWADMYYGDDSSLVYLNGVVGKPILIQDVHTLESEEDNTICFDYCHYENGVIWFTSKEQNGLFQLDTETGITTFLGTIPNERKSICDLYNRIYKYKETLWLIPSRACEIAAYNTVTKEFEKYLVGEEHKSLKLQYSYQKGNTLYMVSADFSVLISLNLESREITKQEIKGLYNQDELSYKPCRLDYSPRVCVVEEKMYFIPNETNIVCEYDLKKNTLEKYSVGKSEDKYCNILFDGKKFWLISFEDAKIVCWQPNKGICYEINQFSEEFIHWHGFGAVCYDNGFLWAYPLKANRCIKVNVNTYEVAEEALIAPVSQVWFGEIIDASTRFYTTRCGQANQHLIITDEEGKCIKDIAVNKPQNDEAAYQEVYSELMEESFETIGEYILFESKEKSIKKAVDELVSMEIPTQNQRKCFSQLYSNVSGTAGKEILKKIMES